MTLNFAIFSHLFKKYQNKFMQEKSPTKDNIFRMDILFIIQYYCYKVFFFPP